MSVLEQAAALEPTLHESNGTTAHAQSHSSASGAVLVTGRRAPPRDAAPIQNVNSTKKSTTHHANNATSTSTTSSSSRSTFAASASVSPRATSYTGTSPFQAHTVPVRPNMPPKPRPPVPRPASTRAKTLFTTDQASSSKSGKPSWTKSPGDSTVHSSMKSHSGSTPLMSQTHHVKFRQVRKQLEESHTILVERGGDGAKVNTTSASAPSSPTQPDVTSRRPRKSFWCAL